MYKKKKNFIFCGRRGGEGMLINNKNVNYSVEIFKFLLY